jgi:hypothetical protein
MVEVGLFSIEMAPRSTEKIFECTFLVPQFDDYLELPLVTAFVCETFRWRPVSAAGACCLLA